MKRIVLCFFMFVTSLSFSQERKLHFGVNAFPNYTKGTEVGSIAIPAFSVGVFIEYNLTEKLKLQVGLGQRMTKFKDPKTPMPAISFASYTAFSTINNDLEIPLLAKYYISKRWYAIAGGSALYTFQRIVTQSYYDANSEPMDLEFIDRYKNIGFSFTANVGGGVDIIKKEKITLYLQPYLTRASNATSVGMLIGIKL
jgi:Outer membrane protein beta-barrel domain